MELLKTVLNLNKLIIKCLVICLLVIIIIKEFKSDNQFKKKTSIYEIINPELFLMKFHDKFDNIEELVEMRNSSRNENTNDVTTMNNNINTNASHLIVFSTHYLLNGFRPTTTTTTMATPMSILQQVPTSDQNLDHLTININKGPQSLAILMNFQNDGTTYFQIINQNENMVVWTDNGYCKHGQILDPSVGVCREVFCMEGFIFTPQGCIQDTSYNRSDLDNQPIRKPPTEIRMELIASHDFCIHLATTTTTTTTDDSSQNLTLTCNHTLIMDSNLFLNEFRSSLCKALQIDESRIDEMKIIFKDKINRTITEDQIDYLKQSSILNLALNNSTANVNESAGGFEKLGISNQSFLLRTERTKLSFLIKEQNGMNPKDKVEAKLLFYYINMLAMDHKSLNVTNHRVSLTDVIEAKDPSQMSWCNEPYDTIKFYRDDFKILASFDQVNKKKFYVYVNETEIIYETGYFYLTVVYLPKNLTDLEFAEAEVKRMSKDKKSFLDMNDLANESSFTRLSNLNLNLETNELISDDDLIEKLQSGFNKSVYLRLTDMTDAILEENTSSVFVEKMLAVCDRAPKIRAKCPNYETVRVKLCELKQMKNRSYCSLFVNICYSIDEYEYDSLIPNEFIRICKYKNTNSSTNDLNYARRDNTSNYDDSNGLLSIIPGWISLCSIVASIVFLIATLITYFLFNDLRNIPGWNIINLTLALTLAQVSFLLGSSISHKPLLCFIASIMTHYGYLASFFWMNVIAFDLYRNFRKKSSHILLFMLTVKDRLPKYALFGWLSPLLIVLVCLIIDLTLSDTNNVYQFKPCYAGYLKGCINYNDFQKQTTKVLNDSSIFGYQNSSNENSTDPTINSTTNSSSINSTSTSFDIKDLLLNDININKTLNKCYSSHYRQIYVSILSRTCWIQSGKANLVFFGLPIGIIIIVNGIFFFLAIYNIRQNKKKQKQNKLRRFSKVKVPGDDDVKFYIQMAFIMGFTWISGFFLTTFRSEDKNIKIVYQIFIYLFIISNSSIGVFIFFVFIFKKDVYFLYKELINKYICYKLFSNSKKTAKLSLESTISHINRKKKFANGASCFESSNSFYASSLRKSYEINKHNQSTRALRKVPFSFIDSKNSLPILDNFSTEITTSPTSQNKSQKKTDEQRDFYTQRNDYVLINNINSSIRYSVSSDGDSTTTTNNKNIVFI